jgi:hypothetical protein
MILVEVQPHIQLAHWVCLLEESHGGAGKISSSILVVKVNEYVASFRFQLIETASSIHHSASRLLIRTAEIYNFDLSAIKLRSLNLIEA